MEKVGRNQPCPCGSGKKFKKCHGPSMLREHGIPIERGNEGATTTPHDANITMMGLSGMQQHLVMKARSSDPNNPINAGPPGGMPGKYKVVFTLSRPGFSPLPDKRFSASSRLKGDSHLAIAEPALTYPKGEEFDLIRFGCTTPHGKYVFTGFPNDGGYLGKVESDPFDASHFGDAALNGHQAIAPALSNLSVHLDVPVNIYQRDVIELRTGSVRFSIRKPFNDVIGWMPPMDEAPVEQQKFASLYREALNSNSSNYQFLCLYKIVEGLKATQLRRRRRALSKAKAKGEQFPSSSGEPLSNVRSKQIEWLNSLYPTVQQWDEMALDSVFINEVVGRTIDDLIGKDHEIHKLRNKIAHAIGLESNKPVISIDNGLDIDEVEKWLPITKFITRCLLKDAFPAIFRAA